MGLNLDRCAVNCKWVKWLFKRWGRVWNALKIRMPAMWFLGKMVALCFWLAFCRHPDNRTKGSQMECRAVPWLLSLDALVFVSWVSSHLNVKPRRSAKNSTEVASKHFACFITTELWQSKGITAFLDIWTAALHGHLQKKERLMKHV